MVVASSQSYLCLLVEVLSHWVAVLSGTAERRSQVKHCQWASASECINSGVVYSLCFNTAWLSLLKGGRICAGGILWLTHKTKILLFHLGVSELLTVDFSFVTFPINRGRCRLIYRTLKILGGGGTTSNSEIFKMFVPLAAKLKMQWPKSHLGCYILLM